MKFLLLLLLLASPVAADPLAGRDGCFLLVRLGDGKIIEETNPRRVEQRFSPCSTFKIALAVMAFDRGIIDDKRIFVWDGKVRERAATNRNQTARSWIVDSVVWVSQQLTHEMGMAAIKDYLAKFRYGNQDMSGGLDQSWLTDSLTISAREQVHFLGALWLAQLPVSKSAMAATRALVLVEGRGADRLDGKTGTGYFSGKKQIGWFVGHLQHDGADYIFALNYSDRKEGDTTGYAGWQARALVTAELEKLHLLPR